MCENNGKIPRYERVIMQVSFGEIARASGVVLVRVQVDDANADVQLTCDARLKDGTPIPSRVAPLDEDSFMITVPLLSAAVAIDVHCVGADGDSVSAATVVTPRQAKLQSRINTATGNATAHLMRSLHAQVESDDPAVVIDRIIVFGDGTEVVRGRMFEPLCGPDAVASKMELRVLGGDGRDGALSEPIMMGESIMPRDTCPALLDHAVSFSVRISPDLQGVVFWAVSDKHPCDRFVSFFAPVFNELRRWWRNELCPADVDPRYEDWFLARRATPLELEAERRATFSHDVKFSLIVPLYETPIDFFHDMAESVLSQTYANLELVLVNASPDNAELTAEVERCRQQDARVKVVTLGGNFGITENTNAGIAAATGDFLCFFDHDDVLEPDILYWYAKGIEDYPETDLLYCDEDKLCDGHYVSPFFKPDWNPDLLRSMNYVCHMLTVRKSIVDELEPPTREVDGPQDHNMTFRVSERARNVFHARRILYHWRIHARSVAGSSEAKPYTIETGRRILQAHLDRCGIPATARANDDIPNTFSLDYHLEEHPLVSIVIPTKDHIDVLDRCISSIFERSTYDNYEIIVVENNSTEQSTFDYYDRIQREHENVRVVQFDAKGKVNVSKANNVGTEAARGDYILLLNNDTQVITRNWIERMLGPCMRADVGAVGAKLLYPDDIIQHAGVMFQYYGPDNLGQGTTPRYSHAYYNMFQETQDVIALSSACLIVEKSLYDEVGGFDDVELPSDYDDVDFCLKIRERGLLVVYEPSAELYHYESVSRPGHGRDPEYIQAFATIIGRNPERYTKGDPYMSPYLKNAHRALADTHRTIQLWHDPFLR